MVMDHLLIVCGTPALTENVVPMRLLCGIETQIYTTVQLLRLILSKSITFL